MINPPRLNRRKDHVVRSQLAIEVALAAYAVIGGLLLLRLGLLALGVPVHVWSGRIVYELTDPIIWPLTLPAGADRALVGLAGLPELTAVALVALVPLALAARDRSQQDGQ